MACEREEQLRKLLMDFEQKGEEFEGNEDESDSDGCRAHASDSRTASRGHICSAALLFKLQV